MPVVSRVRGVDMDRARTAGLWSTTRSRYKTRQHFVNAVGAVIWEQLDGSKSLEAIRDALLERYDSDCGQVEEDLADFIAMVTREGLAEKVE